MVEGVAVLHTVVPRRNNCHKMVLSNPQVLQHQHPDDLQVPDQSHLDVPPLPSNWKPFIFCLTLCPSLSMQTSLHFLGLPGGRNPVCFCLARQSSSDLSSLSMILRTVTSSLGLFLTVAKPSCFSNLLDRSSRSTS